MYSHTDTPEMREQLGIPDAILVPAWSEEDEKAFAETVLKSGPCESMAPFNVLVIGPKGVGKTTFAEHLSAQLGMRVVETSAFLMLELAEFYSDAAQTDFAKNLQALQEKSPGARRQLLAMGHRLTKARPDCLMAGALAMGPVAQPGPAIIVGAKRKTELEAWFGTGYGGFQHTRDVLVEITPGEIPIDDPNYELAGWGAKLSHGGRAKYEVPAGDLAAMARIVAEKIQAL